MLGTGFEHKDTALFFHNVRWDFLKAFRANGSRRFNEAIKSKIRPREFAVGQREVYKLLGIVQVDLSVNK